MPERTGQPVQPVQLRSQTPTTVTSTDDRRQRVLEATLRRHQYRQDALIETLHTAQNLFGYLTPELLWDVSKKLRLPPSKVYGVATFYNFFTLKPAGQHALVVCLGTACYIRGAQKLMASLRTTYGVEPGQTTRDGRLSVLTARCLGSCGLAPAAVLDDVVLSRLTSERLLEQVDAALEAAAPPGAGTQTAAEGVRTDTPPALSGNTAPPAAGDAPSTAATTGAGR